MSIRKKAINVLSTTFLVISLIIAGGLFADAFAPQNAKANANTQDLDICSIGPACVGPPVNCYCEVVVTPEEQ